MVPKGDRIKFKVLLFELFLFKQAIIFERAASNWIVCPYCSQIDEGRKIGRNMSADDVGLFRCPNCRKHYIGPKISKG